MSDILKQKGNEAFKVKDYSEADRLYMSAITLDPTNAVLYSNRAMTLLKLENWQTCEEVCAQGLKLQTADSKTKVKLLWRRGTSLAQLDKFEDARLAFTDALKLDTYNQSVMKSIDELKTRESQFKRSHSIDQNTQDKRHKKESIKREKIPIFEVDELPLEFQTRTSKDTLRSRSDNDIIEQNPVHVKNNKIQIAKSKPIKESDAVPFYPETPSIYQLSTIIKVNDNTKPHALRYVFNIKPDTLTKLFLGGNVDSHFLNFFLESILFSLQEKNDKISIARAEASLKTVSKLPRFSLVKMFIDKSKLAQIKSLLGTEHGDSLADWL